VEIKIQWIEDIKSWLKKQGLRVKLVLFSFLGIIFLIGIAILFGYIAKIEQDFPRNLCYLLLTLGFLIVTYLFGYVHGAISEAKRKIEETERLKKERDSYRKEASQIAQMAQKMQTIEKDVDDAVARKRDILKRMDQAEKSIRKVRSAESQEEFRRRIGDFRRDIEKGWVGIADDRIRHIQNLIGEIRQSSKRNDNKKKEKGHKIFSWPFKKN